jgi:predicted DNA-binding protein (MmcQ/YjbR family)
MTVNTTRPKKVDIARAEAAIVKIAEGFPEVTESGPWGHRAFKIRGKTFLFLVADGDGLSFSVKLPHSGAKALKLPFTEPTGYGLGKSGWVSAAFKSGATIPVELITEWLEESFTAIAPKKLLATRPAASAKRAATKTASSSAATSRSPKTAVARKSKSKSK